MFAHRSFRTAIAVAAAMGTGIVVSASARAAVTTLYVATDGSDTNACTTKAEPCHTMGHAMTLAAPSGTTIHVASGRYDFVSPGSKKVTVVGVGENPDTGTIIAPSLGAAVAVTDAAASLTLRSLSFGSDPIGAYVTAGTLSTSHVTVAGTSCALFMTGGRVVLADSSVVRSGVLGETNCSPLTQSPAAMTVNGGDLSMVRSNLTDTKNEPGLVVNAGTFAARDSVFSDAAYASSTSQATVQIAGGAATIARSLFHSDIIGLQLTGGSTTVTDSTFYRDQLGITSVGGGSQPSVFRTTFVNAQINGPVRLAGDVLTNRGNTTCTEQPEDLGYNYGTGGGCLFTARTSHSGLTTLNLGTAVADHGGPTPTVAQVSPSALIDAIPLGATWGPDHRALCPAGATDQRGVARAQGGGCDVGAFEVAASRTALTTAPKAAAPGQKVVITARVSPQSGAVHDPDHVAGTVSFKTGRTTLCSGKAVSTSGVATCTTTRLPAGRRVVTAAFRSAAPYLDSRGSVATVVGTTPRFTSAGKANATVGTRRTITIRAAGVPRPRIVRISGALPRGMTLAGGNGSATISGTPARGTARTYVLHLRATNVRGTASQTFTLTVAPR